MQPTDNLRIKLRKLLNERIPSGGKDEDTNFLDLEIDDLLSSSETIYGAASLGWSEKAALLQGDIEQYSAGAEQYKVTSLKDRLDHALQMAEHYQSLQPSGMNGSDISMMVRVTRPNVL